MDDGRYNNNGWLQELPDPITKMIWDNAVLDQPQDGGASSVVKNGDLVEVERGVDATCDGPDLGSAGHGG